MNSRSGPESGVETGDGSGRYSYSWFDRNLWSRWVLVNAGGYSQVPGSRPARDERLGPMSGSDDERFGPTESPS